MLAALSLFLVTVAWLDTQPAAIPPSRVAKVVAVLPVHGEMDAIGMEGLTSRVEAAKAAGADAIVLEFDTPGGEMMSTLELCRRIKSSYPPNTVAWIRPRAFSAGTITALACRELIVAPHSVFGDAAPIAVSPLVGLQSLSQVERAKLEAPLLSEVTDSARRRGHDERLCRAFITAQDELWLLEDPARGERFLVDAIEYMQIFGSSPPRSATHDAMELPLQFFPVIPWITDGLRRSVGDTAMESVEASQRLPRARPTLTSSDRDRLRLVSQIDSADALLTLRAEEAVALGLASAMIDDDASLQKFFGATSVIRLPPRWSEPIARFLTSWWFRGLLVIVIVVCFVAEMVAPGLGLFSAVGFSAAILLVGGPLLAGLADWWPAVALLVGLALVAIEILVLPGSLAAGIAGVLIFATGTVGLFVVSDPSPDPTNGLTKGMATLVAALASALTAAWWLGGRSGRSGLFGQAILQTELVRPSDEEAHLIGTEGVASSDLRPIGQIEIQGRVHSARSSGWIERGTRVRVLRIEAGELCVEACE